MIWKKKRIYADAAASTPLSKAAARELIRLLKIYGNPGALHKEAVMAKNELELARESVAKSIGAHPDEIFFTSGGTEGNNLALRGILEALRYRSQTPLPLPQNVTQSDCVSFLHVVTSAIEHSSVLEPLRSCVGSEVLLTELPVSSAGLIDVQAFSESVTDSTVLVSIQFVNSEIGSIQPIREIAKAIRTVRKARSAVVQAPTEGAQTKLVKPLYFHVDASQAPLWKTIRVDKLGVDLLTLDGQKLLGPKGVGALYVRRGVALEAQQLGGGQERGLRSGTENVPLAGAFAVALRDAQAKEDNTAKKISAVRNSLLQEILKRLPDATLNGAVGDERVSNNLNISIPGLDGEMAVIALDALGVAASTRSACDSSDAEPSHVLVALGLDAAVIKYSIRLTLLPNATKSEALAIAEVLQEVAKRYRNMA